MNFAHRLQLAAAVILVALSGGVAWSQAARTIKVVVPVAPGGVYDFVARLLAEQIGRTPAMRMVIENRPGAGGGIGTEAVSRAAPDGNTLLITGTELVINPPSLKIFVGDFWNRKFAELVI